MALFLFPFFCKKMLYEGTGFCSKNAFSACRFWVKGYPCRSESSVRICGSKNNAFQLTPVERSRTHHTRLHCYVKRASFEVLPIQKISRGSNGLHLSMGRDIMELFCQIVSASNYFLLDTTTAPTGTSFFS